MTRFILILFVLCSCGPKATDPNALVEIKAGGFINSFEAGSRSISLASSKIRAATFVTYPNIVDEGADDLSLFSYRPFPGSEADDSFRAAFGHGDTLSIGQDFIHRIPVDETEFEKAKKLSRFVFAAGEARNRFMMRIRKIEQDIEAVKEESSNNPKLKAFTEKYTCYQPKGKAIKRCKTLEQIKEAGLDPLAVPRFVPNGCGFNRLKFKAYKRKQQKQDIRDCEEVALSATAEIEELNADIATYRGLRSDAKSIVVKAYESLSDHSEKVLGPEHKVSYFFKVQTEEESNALSEIVFSPDFTEVESMTLVMDLGLSNPELSGELQEYSFGKKERNPRQYIEGVSFMRDSFGIPTLSFSIVVPEVNFRLEARLSADVSEIFGLRFGGDIYTFRPNPQGKIIKRKGIGLIEFNTSI